MILHVNAGALPPAVVHPRVHVDVGAGAQATLLEVFAGIAPGPYFTNTVTQIKAGPDAIVEHTKIQRESERATHLAVLDVKQERGSNVTQHTYDFGGELVRNDLRVRFLGEGGEVTLNGLYALNGTQHVDNHTFIDHAGPHCTSREFYKGVLDGKSRGVFYGKVLIRKDAQKTNAAQTNKNLLLSTGALADSTPALEINADDVKAQHGSTIGQLDANMLFYLRARGIDAETARSLLTYAFAREVLGRLRSEAIRRHLDALLLSRLPQGPKVQEVLHDVPA
jgi:Fe-S cluster assembly protein SufD